MWRIGTPWITLAAIAVGVALGGCESTPEADDKSASVPLKAIAPRSNDPACLRPSQPDTMRCAMWVDAYRGEPLTYGDMMKDLAGARVIYVGERHGIGRHHHIQARIVTSLIERGQAIVLAMEQLEAYCQPDVDRYNRGDITFAELADAIDWGKRWKNYDQYRAAVEAAHDAGSPILALNARRETVREVAMNSIDGLEPETRAELPATMQLDDPMYRGHMDQVMMVHASVGEDMLQRMFEAQVARDETMADRLCEFLQSPAGQDRVAVVLCGAGHIAHSMGIPSRVRRRMPDITDRIIVLSHSGDVEVTESMKAQARDITITHEELRMLNVPIADYLYVTSLKPAEEKDRAHATVSCPVQTR
jgi:uncharacterized iron-regulated protein